VEDVHRQLVAGLDAGAHPGHVGEVQPAAHAMQVQVHGQRHQVHVAGAFAVAEQAALDPLRAGQHRQFGRGHGGAAVVVRVHAEHDAVAARQVAVHPFDLVGVDVGRGAFHRGRQVDDHLVFGRGAPLGADRIADLQREIQLGQAEGLGRIFVDPMGFGAGVGQRADLASAGQRDLLDLGAAHAEHDAAPLRRDGRVQVHDGAPGAAQRIEGALDQVGARLGQHLDGDVVGDAAFLDQLAHEVEVGVRGRRKRHFDFLQAHGHQLFEAAQLARRVHRFDQGLVAVAHVGAHPDRRRRQAARRPAAFGVVAGEGLDGAVLVLGLFEHGILRPRARRMSRVGMRGW